MQGMPPSKYASIKNELYLAALKQHAGLGLTFLFTLLVPFAGIAMGTLGDELILLPIILGGLFFLMPYFVFTTLKSSVRYYYEIALINQFGTPATATVVCKSIEDNAYYYRNSRHRKDKSQHLAEEIVYTVEYQYSYGTRFKSTFVIDNRVLYDKIAIGSEIPINLLASAPEKSTPRLAELGATLGLDAEECY